MGYGGVLATTLHIATAAQVRLESRVRLANRAGGIAFCTCPSLFGKFALDGELHDWCINVGFHMKAIVAR